MRGYISGYELKIIREDSRENPHYRIIENKPYYKAIRGNEGFAGNSIEERKQAIINIMLETMREYGRKERVVIKGPDIPIKVIDLENLIGDN